MTRIGTPLSDTATRVMLLGAGELGKEVMALPGPIDNPSCVGSNKLLRDPPADDRPYAGWLYGSVGVVARTGTPICSIRLRPARSGSSMTKLAPTTSPPRMASTSA